MKQTIDFRVIRILVENGYNLEGAFIVTKGASNYDSILSEEDEIRISYPTQDGLLVWRDQISEFSKQDRQALYNLATYITDEVLIFNCNEAKEGMN